ncbi:MAG: DNA polymerase IV, partial [Alphaproteobacteria bacterium]|nr:DNA polymerase IV [Alphaproteobacteria bacterium]
ITRSLTLTAATQMSHVIFSHGRVMLEKQVRHDRFWRLIGIGVDQLGPADGADPLDLADPDKSRRQKLEAAMDSLRAKHGTTTIVKGRRLKLDHAKKAKSEE